MALVNGSQAYADTHPGDEASDRAQRHRREAMDRLACDEPAAAVVHAILSLEARVDEMAWHIATR